MIETHIERIADALERLVAHFESDAPTFIDGADEAAQPETEPAPKAPPTDLTLDALRKGLAPLAPAQGRALLEKFGVRKVSELKPDQYQDVLSAAREMR